jgi:thiol-disulfide isomerase/thioredoxin
MQRAIFTRRHTLTTLIILLTFGTLACGQKSVLDNRGSSAPPAAARPSPTQIALKVEPETAASGAASVATSQPKAANVAPASTAAQPAGVPAATPEQDFELQLLDASKLKLSKVLGRRKIVIINFWATWCGPCRREIPELIALQKDYKNKDVEIFGLSIEDPQQYRELVQSFAKQFDINYKVGFSPMSMFMTFNGADQRKSIPQTFVFGRDGKLLQHIKGMRPAFKDYLQQTVDLALKS